MPNELATAAGVQVPGAPSPPTDLVETDEQPLESPLHRATINLLIEQVEVHLAGRKDFYVGGNMFIYFSAEQVRNRDYKGPDFFFVWGADHDRYRPYWAVWEEGGRYPSLIVELLSDTTAVEDLTTKKDLYEQVFQTREYFCYDPHTHELRGWRLTEGRYVLLTPDEAGRLPCDVLGGAVGPWSGEYLRIPARWLRFFDRAGNVLPLRAELEHHRAEAERHRAEAERQRAEAAEAEVARLRRQLEALMKQAPPTAPE
jgi:Uma2 family endonuclease